MLKLDRILTQAISVENYEIRIFRFDFMHIHMWDAHFPYNAPMEYGNPFENDPLPEWLTEEVVERNKSHIGPHSAYELNMFNDEEKKDRFPRTPGNVLDVQNARRVIDGYDTDLRYIDDQVARLVALLKEMGIYEDTAIVISADHGENLGELGIYSEHATADQCTTNIPLIVKWPGMKTGMDHGLHYNIDLTRTFADLLGQKPIPYGDGDSFIKTQKLTPRFKVVELYEDIKGVFVQRKKEYTSIG